MAFSSTPPTSAGYFWMTNQNYSTPVIAQVVQQNAGKLTAYLTTFLYVVVNGSQLMQDGTEQWEGPLSP
jgi:hypothetical protein